MSIAKGSDVERTSCVSLVLSTKSSIKVKWRLKYHHGDNIFSLYRCPRFLLGCTKHISTYHVIALDKMNEATFSFCSITKTFSIVWSVGGDASSSI